MGLNETIVGSGSVRRVVPDPACSSRRIPMKLTHHSLLRRSAALLLTALPAVALLGCQGQGAGAPQGSARAASPVTERGREMPGIQTLEIGQQAVKVTKDPKNPMHMFLNERSSILTGNTLTLRPGDAFTLSDAKTPTTTSTMYRLKFIHENKATFEQTTTERPNNGPVKRSTKVIQLAAFW
jgi:hypothetical protein